MTFHFAVQYLPGKDKGKIVVWFNAKKFPTDLRHDGDVRLNYGVMRK